MKSIVNKAKKQVKAKTISAVMLTAEKAAGAVSWFSSYQPKVPNKLKK